MIVFFNGLADQEDKTSALADGQTAEREFQGQDANGSAIASMWREDGAAIVGESVLIQHQVDHSDPNSWVPVATLDATTQSTAGIFPNGNYRADVSGWASNLKIALRGT